MEIVRPKFTLNRVCPLCEQGGSLDLLTCLGCGHVAIRCDEEGDFFSDPHNLAIFTTCSWRPHRPITLCPRCAAQQEFRYSTGDEIQQLGFSTRDYT